MRKRVYIETTIPSFYFEARSEPSMAVRREWTRWATMLTLSASKRHGMQLASAERLQ